MKKNYIFINVLLIIYYININFKLKIVEIEEIWKKKVQNDESVQNIKIRTFLYNEDGNLNRGMISGAKLAQSVYSDMKMNSNPAADIFEERNKFFLYIFSLKFLLKAI